MSVRTGVNLQFGILSTTVSVDAALEQETSNRTVCCGPKDHPHPVVRITQPTTCEHCGPIRADQTMKAREVGDQLVVLDPQALALIKDVSAFTQQMVIAPHPADEVELHTVPGEKVYYLNPGRSHESNYVVLAQLILDHPEIAFLVRWAPRSRVSVFKLSAMQGEAGPVLVLFERISAGRVRSAPVIRAEVDAVKLQLAEQALTMNRRAMVQRFDPNAYLDDTEDRIQELLAQAVPAQQSGGVDVGLLQLQQMVEQARAAAPKPRARRTKEVA